MDSTITPKTLNLTSFGPCLPNKVTPNPLGIILIIAVVFLCVIFRSQHIYHIVLTLQYLALLSFVEVAYIPSLALVLESLQFLMLFNIMGQNQKSTDYIFEQHNMLKLKNFMVNPFIEENTAIISLSLLAIILVGVLIFIRYLR
jgi:hypothetical protein